MVILKIKSLAGLDGPVLDMITATLRSLANRDPQPILQRMIWTAYRAAVQRFQRTGSNFVDLPHPGAVDSLKIAKIAKLQANDEIYPEAAFWKEVAQQMESARVR
jgi:hypothetical protein